MTRELKTGSTDAIAASIKAAGYAVRREMLRVGTAPDRDAHWAKFDAEKELFSLYQRNELLCRYQAGAPGSELSLGSNMYGWAVHDIMGSNLRGGRASISPRGYSLEQAIAHGCEIATAQRNTTFDIAVSRLPDAVLMALGLKEIDAHTAMLDSLGLNNA